MKKYIIIAALLFPISISAQLITGKVSNNRNEALVGASIFWMNSSVGVTTDEEGNFEISSLSAHDKRLLVSYLGYLTDTISVAESSYIDVIMIESNELTEVVVKGQRDGIVISNINPVKTEQITQTELKRAACCDLAGCFDTQSTVQAHTTNVITNSKELRILGLSGVYNQVLINGLPTIQGLSYTYGISSFPGTVVDNIFISKGANSVLQGFESISGQINVQTRNGDQADKLMLNLYINSFQEKHLNANLAFKMGNWSSLTALHMVQPANIIDRDKDQFIDLPLLTRYSASNTWKYRDAGEWGWNSKIGVRFFNENRVGGQVSFDPKTDLGGSTSYGQTVKINQPEIWTKTGFRFDDVHNIVFSAAIFHNGQNSYFGTVKYDAQQTNFYGKFQYEYNYSDHDFKTGISLRYMDLTEDISFTEANPLRTYNGIYEKKEVIPGLLAENTMRFFNDKLTWIAGARVDQHNIFGAYLTPRTLLKYDFSPLTVVRANIGTGWRTTNLFSENINLLVSSRDILIQEELRPEQAINYGINVIQKYDLDAASGYFSFDFYRTSFQNQIFPDYDTDPSLVIINNYEGISIANGFQGEANLKFREQFDVKIGYNYLDVFREDEEQKQVLPFNSKHRLLGTFSYKPLSNKYHFDLNAHWFGKQRLPNTVANPAEFRRPDFSEAYTIVSAQFTYNFKKMEVYAGCENIFDFRQERPIISWQDPFSQYFDTNSVWGPTRGREFYVGLRYYLKKKEAG